MLWAAEDVHDVQRPTLIFTDGALEYEGNDPVATIGGVLLGPDGI